MRVFFCFWVLVTLALGPQALAAKRVALVIGNAKYVHESELFTPPRDVRLIVDALKGVGFDDVRTAEDLSAQDMRNALREFSDVSANADVALIYFAGHGIEVDGKNFLVPVDAKLKKAKDAKFEAVELEQFRDAVSGAKTLRMVVLDACRNNPFPLESANGVRASRQIGLVEVKASINELIAYSAQQGAVADDGPPAGNSPFAAALAKWIKAPGMDISFVMRNVRDEVLAGTGPTEDRDGPQIPYVESSLGAQQIVFKPADDVKDDTDKKAGEQRRQAQAAFNAAFISNNIDALAGFASTYKDVAGQEDNVRLALLQIETLNQLRKRPVIIDPSATRGSTLKAALSRGHLNCGVNTGLAGFSMPNANGEWEGLDVDTCKAIAAALFGGDSGLIKFIPLNAKERFTALISGNIDILVRNSIFTKSREDMDLSFVGANLFDGQGFMVRKSLGVKTALELSGATVCVQANTTYELSLASYFKSNTLLYNLVVLETHQETLTAYDAGRCDVLTLDASGLAAIRTGLASPEDHMILPERITDDKLGPYVRNNDPDWLRLSRMVLNALIQAEQLGITAQNIDEKKLDLTPAVERFFATENPELGLAKGWTENVIKATGNYAEIFDRNLGNGSVIKLDRGLNALRRDGGLMVPEPF